MVNDRQFGCEHASKQDILSLFLQVQDLIGKSRRFP